MSINILLPNELLKLIFSHCSGMDRKTVAQVCHHWSDVVQSQKNCLSVSIRPRPHERNSRTLFIGGRILQSSSRQYAALNVEWRHKESDRNLQNLSDLLDICDEERCVALQRLFLRAPPNVTLGRFFSDRRAWLKDLVELHVKLETTASGPSVGTGLTEVSLPHLREVSWYEYGADRSEFLSRLEWFKSFTDADISYHAIALNAPELRRLTVGMTYSIKRGVLESRDVDMDACCLFLPSLELKPCRNLEEVTIKGLYSLSQRCVDNSEGFLQNLRMLSFSYCHGDVIQQICGKCPNLKKLTVEEPPANTVSLQISPVVSSGLEHLTILGSGCYFLLNDNTVFPNLKSFRLNYVILGENVTLVAPQLTTCDIRFTGGSKLIIPHVEQIRTLKVSLWNGIVEAPSYLARYVNLKRLTVDGAFRMLHLWFVDHLQQLEWFSANRFTVRLIDVGILAGLKTLILKNVSIKVQPTYANRTEVSLTALEYVRMYNVFIDGGAKNRFPILINERQPPIELVRISDDGVLFSSKTFD